MTSREREEVARLVAESVKAAQPIAVEPAQPKNGNGRDKLLNAAGALLIAILSAVGAKWGENDRVKEGATEAATKAVREVIEYRVVENEKRIGALEVDTRTKRERDIASFAEIGAGLARLTEKQGEATSAAKEGAATVGAMKAEYETKLEAARAECRRCGR
jgi:hypothetical protein